jgi:hypothetical protein
VPDDAFYSPTYRLPPPRQPRPLEHVWSLWKNGRRKDCGLYFHGESYGWECQLRDDGFMEFGQRFIFKEAALRLAASCGAISSTKGGRRLPRRPNDRSLSHRPSSVLNRGTSSKPITI